MRSIQTSVEVALSAVKPLEGLLSYRAYCLAQTRRARQEAARRRDRSPVSGTALEPVGEVEGLVYGRDPEGGGLFLMDVADPSPWARLLADVSRYRHTPEAFHASLAQSRTAHVYAPKVEWIRETLRLHGFERPQVLEVTTAPSDLTALVVPLISDSMLPMVLAMPVMAPAMAQSSASPGVPVMKERSIFSVSMGKRLR